MTRPPRAVTTADNHHDRGASIEARLEVLGISDRTFMDRTGIDRKTLRRAIAGGEVVRPSTYRSIEAALDQLELEDGVGEHAEERLLTFELHTAQGVHVTVKGPVTDADELRRQVEQLVHTLKE